MIIHATNVTGVGASHVVKSFLDSAVKLNLLERAIIYLPATGPLKHYEPGKGKVIRYKRYFGNSISRIIECLFGKYIFKKDNHFIVLGDIPIRGIPGQIILVHQPHLISPEINPLSSRYWAYRVLRTLFRTNLRFAKKIIVQTNVMAEGIMNTYNIPYNRLIVIPQPVPSWMSSNLIMEGRKGKTPNEKMILFYPAAGYIHKNHSFLTGIYKNQKAREFFNKHCEIWLTLSAEEMEPYENIEFVKNLGHLGADRMINAYQQADALLFLSLVESYGLPLVEAISINLPIVSIDLPYSRWLCESNAYYFKQGDIQGIVDAVTELVMDMNNNIYPNYRAACEKFPSSWDVVVSAFLM